MLEWRGEVFQDGVRVAMVEGKGFERISSETIHYALMYGQDGEVQIKLTKIRPRKGKNGKRRR